MAGLGRKEFNSGDILLASEVQGYLQDQAVMVFDDATARGSAIPSPSEGMLTYNKDTDQLELYDGSAFGPVGSDAGLIHIETESFSAVSAVNINDVFSSKYDNYRILFNLTTTSTNNITSARLRVSGSDDSAATYGYATLGLVLGTTTASNFGASTTSFNELNYNVSGAQDTSIVLDILRPNLSLRTLISGLTTGAHNNFAANAGRSYWGNFGNTTIFTGISFIASTGNFTGNYSVYGYRKS